MPTGLVLVLEPQGPPASRPHPCAVPPALCAPAEGQRMHDTGLLWTLGRGAGRSAVGLRPPGVRAQAAARSLGALLLPPPPGAAGTLR